MYGTSHYEKEPQGRHWSSRGFYSPHQSFIATAGAKLGEDITPLKSETSSLRGMPQAAFFYGNVWDGGSPWVSRNSIL